MAKGKAEQEHRTQDCRVSDLSFDETYQRQNHLNNEFTTNCVEGMYSIWDLDCNVVRSVGSPPRGAADRTRDIVVTDDLDIRPPGRAKRVALGAIVVLVVLGAVGSLGVISGAGFFSYRTFLYGTGELYVLNMGQAPMFVSVDGRPRVEVPAGNAKIVEIIGGESEVIATDASNQIKGRYTITARNSHAFLKLTDDQCLAAVKLDPFYRGGAQEIAFAAKLDEKTRVWVPNSKNVVWPRKTFPKALAPQDGPGIWLELVGCPLLEDDKFLDAYVAVRLEERMRRARGEEK